VPSSLYAEGVTWISNKLVATGLREMLDHKCVQERRGPLNLLLLASRSYKIHSGPKDLSSRGYTPSIRYWELSRREKHLHFLYYRCADPGRRFVSVVGKLADDPLVQVGLHRKAARRCEIVVAYCSMMVTSSIALVMLSLPSFIDLKTRSRRWQTDWQDAVLNRQAAAFKIEFRTRCWL
jgi:hypothetical protein